MDNNLSDNDFLDEAPSVNEFGGDNFHVTSSDTDSDSDTEVSDEEMVVDVKDDQNNDEESDDEQQESDDEAPEDENSDENGEDDEEESDEDEIPNTVPRSRLNKEVEKRKRLQEQYNELQAKLNSDETAPVMEDSALSASFELDIDEKNFEKMQDALLEGQTKDALSLFKGMMQDVASNTAEFVTKQTSDKVLHDIQVQEQNKVLAQTAESVYESYPEFDMSSDEADTDIIAEVIDKRDFYLDKRRLAPDVALKRAADEVAAEYGFKNRTETAVEAKPKKKKNLDLARKTELAKKEGGKLNGSSSPNKRTSLDINKLSDEQWAKLSPEAKAKARGDFL